MVDDVFVPPQPQLLLGLHCERVDTNLEEKPSGEEHDVRVRVSDSLEQDVGQHSIFELVLVVHDELIAVELESLLVGSVEGRGRTEVVGVSDLTLELVNPEFQSLFEIQI